MDDVFLNSEMMKIILEVEGVSSPDEFVNIAVEKYIHQKEIEEEFNLRKYGSVITSADAVLNLTQRRF